MENVRFRKMVFVAQTAVRRKSRRADLFVLYPRTLRHDSFVWTLLPRKPSRVCIFNDGNVYNVINSIGLSDYFIDFIEFIDFLLIFIEFMPSRPLEQWISMLCVRTVG